MKCGFCDGKGTLKGKNSFPFTCPVCLGQKEVKRCLACKGLGQIKAPKSRIGVVCAACKGNGMFPKKGKA